MPCLKCTPTKLKDAKIKETTELRITTKRRHKTAAEANRSLKSGIKNKKSTLWLKNSKRTLKQKNTSDKLSQSINIDRILIEVVDETLSILGDQTRKVIYVTLQEKYGLKKEDIHDNIGVLESIMYQMFGITAAVLKEEIIQRLKDRLEADPIIEEVNKVKIIKMFYDKSMESLLKKEGKTGKYIDVEQ